MIVAVGILALCVALLFRKVRKLEREQLATLLQVAAMFESAKACDDALAEMIGELGARDGFTVDLSQN